MINEGSMQGTEAHLWETGGMNMMVNTDVAEVERPAREARSTLISRNVIVEGKRTSVRLEGDMWVALMDIARREGRSINELATLVSRAKKPRTSLTAAIRVFIMGYYKAAATEEGHQKAGHGSGDFLVRFTQRPRQRLGETEPAE